MGAQHTSNQRVKQNVDTEWNDCDTECVLDEDMPASTMKETVQGRAVRSFAARSQLLEDRRGLAGGEECGGRAQLDGHLVGQLVVGGARRARAGAVRPRVVALRLRTPLAVVPAPPGVHEEVGNRRGIEPQLLRDRQLHFPAGSFGLFEYRLDVEKAKYR